MASLVTDAQHMLITVELHLKGNSLSLIEGKIPEARGFSILKMSNPRDGFKVWRVLFSMPDLHG